MGGSTLGLISEVLEDNADIPAQECLATLAQVFGTKDMRMTCRIKLLTCSQRPQESLCCGETLLCVMRCAWRTSCRWV